MTITTVEHHASGIDKQQLVDNLLDAPQITQITRIFDEYNFLFLRTQITRIAQIIRRIRDIRVRSSAYFCAFCGTYYFCVFDKPVG